MVAAWAEAVARGKRLLDMLNCGSGPQSPWKDFDALARWGYTMEAYPPPANTDESGVNAMNYLELSPLPEMTEIGFNHDEDSNNDGIRYRSTGAGYMNYYSSQFITAVMNYGLPKEFVGPLPRLRQLSDIWFVTYSNFMASQNKPLDGLKGVLQHLVINGESKSIISKVMNSVDANLVRWPGDDFQPNSDESAALLGSPNGRGAAWLLINRKQLGHKTFDSVRVWYDGSWMMLFVCKDISDELSDEQSSPDPDSTLAETAFIQRSVPSAIVARALRPEQYEQLVERARGSYLIFNSMSDELSRLMRYEP